MSNEKEIISINMFDLYHASYVYLMYS